MKFLENQKVLQTLAKDISQKWSPLYKWLVWKQFENNAKMHLYTDRSDY